MGFNGLLSVIYMGHVQKVKDAPTPPPPPPAAPPQSGALASAADTSGISHRKVLDLFAVFFLGLRLGIEKHADLKIFYRNQFFHQLAV